MSTKKAAEVEALWARFRALDQEKQDRAIHYIFGWMSEDLKAGRKGDFLGGLKSWVIQGEEGQL